MNIILYKSATCPQCKVAKIKLEQKGLPYTEMYVENMSAEELAAAGVYGIPTLITNDGKYTTIKDISNWIKAQEVCYGKN